MQPVHITLISELIVYHYHVMAFVPHLADQETADSTEQQELLVCSFFVCADPVFQLCLEITISSIVADLVLYCEVKMV